jgi:ectoine hydroxylase-related dioxygenase (phytanoyl-CoA dioxygenase family)
MMLAALTCTSVACCAPSSRALSPEQVADYHADGFTIARGFLSEAEVSLVRQSIERDESLVENRILLADGKGGDTKLALWTHPGNSTMGMLTRSARVLQSVRALLGGNVLHYHSKTMIKPPKEGGKWNWHQDYGYWYSDYFLTPEMLTVYFAIDEQTAENGPLRLLRGSHRMGRVDHWSADSQQGADLERVARAKERFEEVECRLKAGDAVFFSGNTLHGSEGNYSPKRRIALASCFTRADNVQFKNPYLECTELEEVEDGALVENGLVIDDSKSKGMLSPSEGKASASKQGAAYDSMLDKATPKGAGGEKTEL